MKALKDSKLGQAIFSNPELQQVVMEMWEISKEEGTYYSAVPRQDVCCFTEGQVSTHSNRPSRHCSGVQGFESK